MKLCLISTSTYLTFLLFVSIRKHISIFHYKYDFRFGMLFSLKDLASKLSPPSQGKENLHTIKTNAFTLHHFESISGLVFVLNTDPEIPSKRKYFLLSILFPINYITKQI